MDFHTAWFFWLFLVVFLLYSSCNFFYSYSRRWEVFVYLCLYLGQNSQDISLWDMIFFWTLLNFPVFLWALFQPLECFFLIHYSSYHFWIIPNTKLSHTKLTKLIHLQQRKPTIFSTFHFSGVQVVQKRLSLLSTMNKH